MALSNSMSTNPRSAPRIAVTRFPETRGQTHGRDNEGTIVERTKQKNTSFSRRAKGHVNQYGRLCEATKKEEVSGPYKKATKSNGSLAVFGKPTASINQPGPAQKLRAMTLTNLGSGALSLGTALLTSMVLPSITCSSLRAASAAK